MLQAALFLAIGTVLLAVGSNVLIKGASGLALRAGISPLVIGLTVVAFGTSAPELVVSVRSAIQGNSDVALGNVVGSNIANVLLILGLSSLIRPLRVSLQVMKTDVPAMIIASLLLCLVAYDGIVTRIEGGILFACLVAYVVIQINSSRTEKKAAQIGKRKEVEDHSRKVPSALIAILLTVVGLLVLLGGAEVFLNGALTVARWLGLSELTIGLTVVAVGTSLPEIATSLTAAYKGKDDIAVGNVVGSNIFNIFGVLGITALITPVVVAKEALALDIPVMIGAAVACIPIMGLGLKISRFDAICLFSSYIAYVFYII